MKKQIVTIAVLAAALAVSRFARKPEPGSNADPQRVIYEMLGASKAGDVARYLACYTGSMAIALGRTTSEQNLRQTNASLRGVALLDPQFITANEASVQANFIHSDRTESQIFYLEKDGSSRWRIVRTGEAQAAKTLVPYGTPIRLAQRKR